jgi:hypothetical protein
MRIASIAAFLAIALTTSGLAALTADRGAPQYSATPVRSHVTLGEVRLLIKSAETDGVTLPDAARLRYGKIDALKNVRTVPLPFGDGAMVTGAAIRWN